MTELARQELLTYLRGRIEAVRADVAALPRSPENVGIFAQAGQMITGLRSLVAEFEK